MATRLEIAERKLTRLYNELNTTTERAFSNMRLTNGQPMNDKRNGATFFKKQNSIEDKAINLTKEIEQQEERVAMLKRKQYKKENHLTNSGGLQTSVKNIEALKQRIKKQEDDIAKGNVHNYSKAYLRKDKKKLELLEQLKEQADKSENIMSAKTKELIDNGQVRQWQKKPIYYFVTGLRKVALIIDENGQFKVSNQYPTKTDEDLKHINNLLAI